MGLTGINIRNKGKSENIVSDIFNSEKSDLTSIVNNVKDKRVTIPDRHRIRLTLSYPFTVKMSMKEVFVAFTMKILPVYNLHFVVFILAL